MPLSLLLYNMYWDKQLHIDDESVDFIASITLQEMSIPRHVKRVDRHPFL
jgi:hypothetical protein